MAASHYDLPAGRPRRPPLTRLTWYCVGLVLALAATAVTILGALDVSAHLAHRAFGPEIGAFAANDTNQLVIGILACPLVVLCLVACRHLLDRRSVTSLGLRPRHRTRLLAQGTACGALASAMFFGVLWLCGGIQVGGLSPQLFQDGAFSVLTPVAVFALLFGCVALVRELVFRGYILHNLNAALGWQKALVTQALLCALLYPLFLGIGNGGGDAVVSYWQGVLGPVNAALGALFLGLCYRKTGSLWFAIGFSSAWSLFLECIWSVPLCGAQSYHLLDVNAGTSSLLSGGTFGSEGSIVLAPIIICLAYLMQQLPDHPQALLDLALSLPAAPHPGPATVAAAPLLDAAAGNDRDASEEEKEEEEERAPSRFRTSMRPRSEQPAVDPAFFDTSPPSNQASPTAATAGNNEEARFRFDVGDNAAPATEAAVAIPRETGAAPAFNEIDNAQAAPPAKEEPVSAEQPADEQPAGKQAATEEPAARADELPVHETAAAPPAAPSATAPASAAPASAEPSPTPRPKTRGPRW